MPKVALNFEDGVTRFIDAMAGETVADAAYRSQINIPMDCRDGACGTCKCQWESGQFEMDDYIDDALSEQEAEAGKVLTCCMVAETDCVINVPALSSLCVQTQMADIHAEVVELDRLSPSTLSFTLASDQVRALHFLPGQYVNLQVPGTDQSRAYSFSSLVQADSGAVSFLVRVVPDGLMSHWLTHDAKPGDSMTLRGPFGSFYLRDVKRPLLMLAGGTGLAPFLAMLEKLERDGCPQPVHLIYGVTNDSDLVELDTLEGLAARIDNFSFTACAANPEAEYPVKGFVTHHMNDAVLHHGDLDIYLCGPPPMVDAVNGFITDKGIQPVNFYYEKFASS
ncbi:MULTISPECIES: benzoate 1,2-dioxygenase electron transfer component BenC [unclassified Oceanobacter]|jgi:benzoate/toluate 1,2-dioxygenase reductase subunit|uniref:benzoate 1,2-dioxygenase electron transfer component BenC n=1 Tax=unclassified Oceanobacter TaxID=2620260 RepID=UPI0026E2DD70|nr:MULTISPECIES: benzoate 1,2-dioxygenase electron transfer component BenC [unclassified Oceanobacter]MDO6682664.1 benzoate 1,2-dioxygenase electron transfer component BenC [Oceanobacter sp. 5_MG-2023]MDP2505833.1 benzoate 1,2-dioxygenase electron transfer component BenC [Oceanobacter sp. 3_MG-2023]MDP2548426.1 benzoate 1,2-dioxygenase electron transfer component BenC [Oceanobacter sp. 4_MG-2023]